MLSPLYKSEIIYFYESDLSLLAKACQPKLAVDFRIATSDDIRNLEKVMYYTYSELVVRFVRKSKCFIGFVENKIAYYAWISILKEYIPEIDREINLAVDEVYIYNVRTLQEYRNRGIATYAYNKILEYCKNVGFKRILVSVCRKNISSIRSIEKAGFRRTKETKYTKIFCFRRYKDKKIC